MMKKFLAISAFVAVASAVQAASGDTAPCYSNNRAPLLQKPYIELPLGSIRAKGWLLEMLRRQKDGASGQMDTLYPEVMGQRNGWLGGDGDQWERGPYWIDGLLPLAYILDDKELKKKVQPWIEWTLKSQREDGYFGPAKDYGYEPGLQRDNSADWWPRMVVLKIMQQYYSATQDRRVVDFMTRYFHYQLATLPSKPLGNWTFWAEYRACDNLQAVYWLYNITGDMSFAGHLERVAFNALPTKITDDFMYKQYFQQANQVMITRHRRNFYEEGTHKGTDIVFGTLSGYPCCFSNMHQGWPKFTQSLWYATPDNGLAALVYSPSEVTALVADGRKVTVSEETAYPMDGTIRMTVRLHSKADRKSGVSFPLSLRIPEWCDGADVRVNGEAQKISGNVLRIDSVWREGDVVTLSFPMHISTNAWHEGAVSIERGPLVYGLRMEEEWKKREFPENERAQFGRYYYEVTSPSKWNYGILNADLNKGDNAAKVIIDEEKLKGSYPWNLENAPIQIKLKAKELTHWQLYNEMAGHTPFHGCPTESPVEEITLIPYGCTTLRISEFPVVY